jgi:twitching motility two-component system response regulator PilG
MQGSLNEIDIRSILQLIELGQKTGELLIEAPALASSPRAWFLFFVNGQIAYGIESGPSPLARLQDYLYPDRIKVREELGGSDPRDIINIPEYAYLWQLIAKNTLTPERGREILTAMILETLFDLFSLPKGDFSFSLGTAISPPLLTLEISPLIPQIARQKQQWPQFYPQIQHLDQFIRLTRPEELESVLPWRAYSNLGQWAERRLTLRQLSRYLKREPITIARNLYPYAQRGWLHLVDSPRISGGDSQRKLTPSPLILFIDDDLSIRQKVASILENYNYSCRLFGDPLEALGQAIAIEPALILCDIALPKLDGYQLCHLWRQTKTLRDTPIIMLTGQEGLLERVKAKMVGATDYLSKPFSENELLLLLEKYVQGDRA